MNRFEALECLKNHRRWLKAESPLSNANICAALLFAIEVLENMKGE